MAAIIIKGFVNNYAKAFAMVARPTFLFVAAGNHHQL